MEHKFAVWITGLPASGKSTIAAGLKAALAARGIGVGVLESDALRKILTPNPTYQEQERETFYRQMAEIGELLVHHGVPVIFDATANRRIYRDYARRAIQAFLEVYVECPLEICVARDPKGIYRDAQASGTVPGLQEAYERPEKPEIVLDCQRDSPEHAVSRIMTKLTESSLI